MVADKNAVAHRVEADNVGGQAAVLCLAQQLLLAHVVDAEGVPHPGQQPALVGHQGPRDAPHRRLVDQLQGSAVPQPVHPDEALCSQHAT